MTAETSVVWLGWLFKGLRKILLNDLLTFVFLVLLRFKWILWNQSGKNCDFINTNIIISFIQTYEERL